MYERVLLATDGSADATAAAGHAVDIARQYGAVLHVLYVIETRTAYDNAIIEPEIVHEKLREEGEVALDAVESLADTDVEVHRAVREGVPPDEILAYAADHDVDLVVMGSKGRSAFKTLLLGSATEAVLRSVTVPVLVVGTAGRSTATPRHE